MTWLTQYARLALRAVVRNPGLTTAVVLTLTVGIGASTAMFSVVRGVLMQPLAFERPDELFSLWLRDADRTQAPFTPADFVDLETNAVVLSQVAGRWAGPASLTGDGDPEEVGVAWVSANYFATLGLRAGFGRLIGEGELDAVVLSDALWQRRYGGDSTIVGRGIELGGNTMHVVGVLPPGVNPNVATVGGSLERNDILRLWPRSNWIGNDRTTGWIRVIARAAPGTPRSAVDAELAAISSDVLRIVGDRDAQFEVYAIGLLDELVAGVRPYLITLAGGVAFVFLIACVNVTNLLTLRAHRRGRELAVRTALGAGRRALAGQMLSESILLGTLGAIGGTVFAYGAVRALVRLQPATLPRLDQIQVDGVVLLFSVTVSLLAAIVVGVVPALKASRADPISMLGERGGTSTRRQHRLARGLIALEVALSLLLLTGSGLMLRTLAALSAQDPGFVADGLMTFSLIPGPAGLANAPQQSEYFRRLLERIESTPGVARAGVTNRFPLTGGMYTGRYATEAQEATDQDGVDTDFRWITAGYLESMSARLLAGRLFDHGDDQTVVIVDDKLARAAWPGEDPIGRRLWTGTLGVGDWSTVIGVVNDIRHESLVEDSRPTVYIPGSPGRRYVAVKLTGATPLTLETVRRTLDAHDPAITISDYRPATAVVSRVLAPTRFILFLISAFAGSAVLLAVIGIFSVVGYAVRQRAREFGLRLALGASPASIFRLVVAQSAVLGGIGIGVGIIGVIALTRLMTTMLFGVDPVDPLTIAGAAGLMVLTSVAGAAVPARRAAHTNPVATLKDD